MSGQSSSAIVVNPHIQGGIAVLAGTRVPLRNLIDYFEAGDTIDSFLTDFPSVSRELAVQALEEALVTLTAHARTA